MSNLEVVCEHCGGAVVPALRPSEYTAALIDALRARAAWAEGADALELGSGSGVVLGALGALGAASLCGVDIEIEAVAATSVLLDELGYGATARIHLGDMWRPVAGRRFDLIAANLPHFPMEPVEFGGRLPSWSCGGPDGRSLLDRFLDGLAAHLSPRGRAIITHNAFVGLDRSRVIAARSGLSLRLAATILVHIPVEKLRLMTQRVLYAEEGRSIHRVGPYAFTDMHIVEIGTPEALA